MGALNIYLSILMAKTQPPRTGGESNLRDRVLGEVGKDSFSALPAKQATASSCPQNYGSQFGEGSEKFYVNCLKRA